MKSGQVSAKLYEDLCYERIVQLAQDSELAKSVIAKGAYTPKVRKIGARLGQDGFFYKMGDVYVRGNGQDLAEADALVIGNTGNIVVCEATVAEIDVDEISEEARYKKVLFRRLLRGRTVSLLLIGVPEANANTNLEPFLREDGNYLAWVERPVLTSPVVPPGDGRRGESSKLLDARNIPVERLDYFNEHNRLGAKVVDAALKNRPIESLESTLKSSVVKIVIVGALYPNAIDSLLQKFEISIPGITSRLTPDEYKTTFNKAVLALTIPELRPTLYLRLIAGYNYLKFGPTTSSSFGFERNTESRNTALYDLLETVRPLVGKRAAETLLGHHMRAEVIGLRNKKKQLPHMTHP